jgi:protein associated with RNAse G/E
MATPPYWEGDVLRSVDLDLDVIQGLSGRVWVDDEDEFADHRVRWGYPPDVVRGAMAAASWVEAAVRDRRAPFDGETHLPWLHRLTPD